VIAMPALNTDLYELTMAAGYFAAGKTNDVATFELSVRRLPAQRNFLVTAGLAQVVEYLTGLHFKTDEIEYLRSLRQFANVPAAFFEFLERLRFTGDVFAMPEGTPAFAGEPILIVRAPLIEAQLIETYLLSSIAYQTTIASKAARCVLAGKGRAIVEFGSRRAHSPAAGPLAGRAAYIAGCTGTSNAEAGLRYGVPVFGTAAHSWVMSFPDEETSFRALQTLLGESTVYLVDTYDPIEGTKLAIRLGRPIWGVRLDSGDLAAQGKEVRRLLDEAGMADVKIMATNDLNERRIAALLDAGAPIDAFGVGTELATSADAPALSAVYKLVEVRSAGAHAYTAKFSEDKATLPGAKQIYRCADHDLITLYTDCEPESKGEPLLRPILIAGAPIEPYPALKEIREYAAGAIRKLPEPLLSLNPAGDFPVRIGAPLAKLAEEVRSSRQLVTS
jgi:nicotinate phosphoribosyltransferase